MVVKLDSSSEEFLALGSYPPASSTWDLANQPADMESFKDSGDSRAVFPSLLWIASPRVDLGANVFVSEAVYQVIAMQDGFEYLDVPLSGRIEARIPPMANFLRLNKLLHLLISGGGIVNDSQRVQVALVGAARDLFIAEEVRHAFVRQLYLLSADLC